MKTNGGLIFTGRENSKLCGMLKERNHWDKRFNVEELEYRLVFHIIDGGNSLSTLLVKFRKVVLF